jgi:G3E family GTPase
MAQNLTQTQNQTPRDQLEAVFQLLNKSESLEALHLILKAGNYYNLYVEYMEKAKKIFADKVEEYSAWADEIGSTKDDLAAEILWRFVNELERLIEELPSPFRLLDKAAKSVPPEVFKELKEAEEKKEEERSEEDEEEEYDDDDYDEEERDWYETDDYEYD